MRRMSRRPNWKRRTPGSPRDRCWCPRWQIRESCGTCSGGNLHHDVLNAGVPVAEVARRVGNSPEVIHRVYEGVIYGQKEAMNQRIEEELNWPAGLA